MFAIVMGSILLILGLLLLISSMNTDWESKEYKKISNKNAPKDLKMITLLSGSVMLAGGVASLWWGMKMKK